MSQRSAVGGCPYDLDTVDPNHDAFYLDIEDRQGNMLAFVDRLHTNDRATHHRRFSIHADTISRGWSPGEAPRVHSIPAQPAQKKSLYGA